MSSIPTKKLQIVMPMAGLGSRFANAGFELPKPLIEVDSVAMFLKAISSIKAIDAEKEYYFIIRQEHAYKQALDSLIKNALPEANVIIIPKITRGAAETAAAALPHLSDSDALIIMDCDLWFSSASYNKMVEESLREASDIAGGVLTFKADNPRYSYAKIDSSGLVMETAEKKVISDSAITGAYFFANTRVFADAVDTLMSQPLSDDMPEYYLSFLYNILIDEGKKIKAAKVDEFASFGTPEELSDYNEAKQ